MTSPTRSATSGDHSVAPPVGGRARRVEVGTPGVPEAPTSARRAVAFEPPARTARAPVAA